jgi:glyoxylase-like metal-dependent hydrolase (beta-lactamase superfamily II)
MAIVPTLAQLDVITTGYAADRVASTCTLLRDGSTIVVVDPGMVARRSMLTDPLAEYGLSPADVTDVVISHHHPDHTVNIALFANARVHDYMATYVADEWIDHEGEFALTESIRLRPTPGHTPEDVTTLVTWTADGPADDPFAADRELLRASREAVLDLAPSLVVPGHGAPFAPTATTSR